jgi:hypothetical protein
VVVRDRLPHSLNRSTTSLTVISEEVQLYFAEGAGASTGRDGDREGPAVENRGQGRHGG